MEEDFKDLIYPLSCREVAEISGVSVRTIEGYAQGRTVPKSFIKQITRRKILVFYKYSICTAAKKRFRRDFKAGVKRAIRMEQEL